MENIVIQLRELNEYVYCRKLAHLMYVQGLFEENADTLTGSHSHEKREEEGKNTSLEGVKLNTMTLYGYDGRLCGKLDNIYSENGEYVPVEDINSKMPESNLQQKLCGIEMETGAWLNDVPQLLGQMYLLRQNGYPCSRGKIYYRGSNKMVEIPYQKEYDIIVEQLVSECILLYEMLCPSPLVDSEKCIRCSLNWICLPDEVNHEACKEREVRRLYPGRPDGSIMYVSTIGAKVGKDGESFSVWLPSGEKTLVPIKDVEHICVYGNVQVTTQATQALISEGGSVFYFSSSGWFMAMTSAPVTKNIELRIRQFSAFGDKDFCASLVKKLVASKLENQRTFLRRNGTDEMKPILRSLKKMRDKANVETDIDMLRGFEGNGASEYWKGYQQLIGDKETWVMDGRNRRPPKDEINAMLSYGYSLLLRDCISAIASTGMDYLYGFYHVITPGRPAFALDLMEPYRPLLVDSVVLRLVNENIVNKKGFARTQAGVFMSSDTKKKLIAMYEQRLDEMITHPEYGYRLSYRRMLQLEAKLLAKYIMGETEDYKPLTTR